MEKLNIAIIFLLLLFSFDGNSRVYAQKTDFPVPQWTAGDLLDAQGGVSILQPGSFGAGQFPYRTMIPPVSFDVRLNGAPLPAFSPFGPNMERLPIGFTDSITVISNQTIRLASLDSIPENPITRIGFLSGERRRYRFHGTFNRKITGRSAIFIGGAADGIRGNALIQGSASRLYSFKYIYFLENGGMLKTEAGGGRDRSDVYDLAASAGMGSHRIDNTFLSSGLERYPLSPNVLFSSLLYYRNGDGRLQRYGTGMGFIDDSFGAAGRLEIQRNGMTYCIDLTNDARFFDNRTGKTGWSDNITGFYSSVAWKSPRIRLSIGGGGRYSTEYGLGAAAEGEISIPVLHEANFVARGMFTHRFPGPEHLFYPSMAYSDTLGVSELDKHRISELETGFQNRRGNVEYGVYGFTAFANVPRFIPIPASMLMTGDELYGGGRIKLGIVGMRSFRYEAEARLEYTGGSSMISIWPRPVFRAEAKGNLSRIFFHGNLHSAAFGRILMEHRAASPVSPDGGNVFLEGGISAKISSLILYYQVENITGAGMRWFGVYSVQGRNSVWGVRWNLHN